MHVPELSSKASPNPKLIGIRRIRDSCLLLWLRRVAAVGSRGCGGGERSGDGGETMVLLGLVVVLLAVLRRRRALRALYGPPPGPLQRDLSRPIPPGARLPLRSPLPHRLRPPLSPRAPCP